MRKQKRPYTLWTRIYDKEILRKRKRIQTLLELGYPVYKVAKDVGIKDITILKHFGDTVAEMRKIKRDIYAYDRAFSILCRKKGMTVAGTCAVTGRSTTRTSEWVQGVKKGGE